MAREWVRILGVDTSLRSTGVAVIETTGVDTRALQYGTLKNARSRPMSACLAHLHDAVTALIEKTQPVEVAVEGVFYCRNVKTALILGQARGAIIAACAARQLPIYEYSPRSVKKGIVGLGAAQKDQVGLMVQRLLGLPDLPQEDEADALAIAMCHAQHRRLRDALGQKAL